METASELIFAKAVSIAATIGIDEKCVADGVYYGKARRYVIVTTLTEPTFFGDDEPLVDRYMVSIDVYIPLEENYHKWLDGFRLAMEGEFDDVTYDGQTTDTEAEKRHLMFNGLADIIRG